MSRILTRQAVLNDLEAVVPLFDAYRQFSRQFSTAALWGLCACH
jgi:hypothetical protein